VRSRDAHEQRVARELWKQMRTAKNQDAMDNISGSPYYIKGYVEHPPIGVLVAQFFRYTTVDLVGWRDDLINQIRSINQSHLPRNCANCTGTTELLTIKEEKPKSLRCPEAWDTW
jgi:hypothetical protein